MKDTNISTGNTAHQLCTKRTLKPVNWLFQHCDVSINEINVSATVMSFPIHSKNGRQKVNTSNTACFLSKVLSETSAKKHSQYVHFSECGYCASNQCNFYVTSSPDPFPLGLHALPLGLLDRTCTQAGPTSSL